MQNTEMNLEIEQNSNILLLSEIQKLKEENKKLRSINVFLQDKCTELEMTSKKNTAVNILGNTSKLT